MGLLFDRTIGPKTASFIRVFSVFGCVAINGSIIIGGVVEVSEVLHEYFGWNQMMLKFVILGIVLLITMICLEPERLKPVGYLSGSVIITIGRLCFIIVLIMFSDNTIKIVNHDEDPDKTITYFSLAGTGIFCGIGGFAYEACGTIFTVRESMREKKKMPVLLATTFTFIGLMFLFISLSFYLVLLV